jgi:uncharacterized integral membrane protein
MAKYCPNCGENISEKVKFCPGCGADISSYKVGTTTSPNVIKSSTVVEKTEKNFTYEIIICICVLVLGILILLALNVVPVERILYQNITIAQMASICSERYAVLVGFVSNRSCDFYLFVNSFGVILGYLFIITGFISSFVIFWQHKKNLF